MVEVSLDRFPIGQFPAKGHVPARWEGSGSEADDRELLARHRINTGGFSGRASLKVPAESGREDCALPTVLLQGWGGKGAPLLPAVSLEALEGGAQRLWVHTPAWRTLLIPWSGGCVSRARPSALAAAGSRCCRAHSTRPRSWQR